MAGAFRSEFSSGIEDELDGAGAAVAALASLPEGEEPEAEDPEATQGLEQLERHAHQHAWSVFEDSKAQMQPRRQDWRRDWLKYRGKYIEVNDDSPLKELNQPKLAKICDLFAAKLMGLTVPDKDRLDFIELIPDEVAETQMGPEVLEQYAKLATIHIRNDLRRGNFIPQYRRNLLDLLVTGNMIAMPVYEQDIQYRFDRVENPEYNHELPPELNVTYTEVKGDQVETPIEPDVIERKAHRAYDAPKYRYLNPRRVFPAEPDKHNYTECSAVCITDTIIKADMLEDEIAKGGYLYANLDKVKASKEDSAVKEIEDDTQIAGGANDYEVTTNNPAARKLRRVTYMGRLDLDEFCYGEDGEQTLISPAAKELFYKKFDIDPAKRTGWRNWIIEIVDNELVRCQPVPYFRDAIPLVHFGLFAVPNQSTADGVYDRAEKNESIFNALNRYGLELNLKMVRPMYGVVRQNIDPVYWQSCGGRLDYAPGKIIPLQPGTKVEDTIQTMQWSAAPLQATAAAMLQEERAMSEMTHFPNVKQGTQSGGNTATEVAAMSANADAMIDEIAQAIEMEFLRPMVDWMLELHHQFTMAPKSVYDYDDSGKDTPFDIPPQVWLHRYYVNMMGYRQTGNMAVRVQAFEKFVQLLERAQIANWPAIATHMAKEMRIPFGKQFITEPPPPPGPDVKYSVSLPLNEQVISILPPEAIGQLLMKMEIQLTPEAQAALGVNADNLNMMKALDAGNSGSGPDGRPSDANDGRNHHAPGEHAPSRGLGDEAGIQKSLGQSMRDPNAGRAAAAI